MSASSIRNVVCPAAVITCSLLPLKTSAYGAGTQQPAAQQVCVRRERTPEQGFDHTTEIGRGGAGEGQGRDEGEGVGEGEGRICQAAAHRTTR